MFLIFYILQVIFAKAVFTQISSCQNVPFSLANTQLADVIRKTRQINLPVANPPINGFANNLASNNGIANNNLAQYNRMPNPMAINNGLPLPNMAIQSCNNMPVNRMPNSNGAVSNGYINPNSNRMVNIGTSINGLQNANFANGFMNANNMPLPNTMPSLSSIINSLSSYNNVPFGNNLPNSAIESGFSFDNMPYAIPSMNNNVRIINNIDNELPISNMGSCNSMCNVNNFPNAFVNGIAPGNVVPNINNLQENNQVIASNLATDSLNNMFPNNMQNGNVLPNINNLQENNQMIANSLAMNSVNNMLPNTIPSGNIMSDINNFLDNNQIIASNMATTNLNNMSPNNFPTGNLMPDINNFEDNNQIIVNNLAMNSLNDMMFPNNIPASNVMPDISNLQENNQITASNLATNGLNNLPTANLPPGMTRFSVNNSPFTNMANNMPMSTGISNNFPSSSNTLLAGNTFASNMASRLNMNVPCNTVNRVTNIPNAEMNMNRLRNNLMPGNNGQILANNLSYGTPMFANIPKADMFNGLLSMPNDCKSGLASNLNMFNEMANNNLQIEAFGNMPYTNGLPVSGIAETFSALNPCNV